MGLHLGGRSSPAWGLVWFQEEPEDAARGPTEQDAESRANLLQICPLRDSYPLEPHVHTHVQQRCHVYICLHICALYLDETRMRMELGRGRKKKSLGTL